ncbi:MAG: hypothetical protein FJY67_06285 [Calditrichaeota bacterium]|nr:hypothetical protein [Calditrichota bacterium]
MLRGRVEGCGYCSVGPVGGFERRATVIKRLAGDRPLVGFDAGSVLDLDPLGGEARSRCTILALGALGTRILAPTTRDFFYGRRFLVGSAIDGRIRLVSANIVESGSSRPLFAVWDTVRIGDLTIAATGLADPSRGLPDPNSDWRLLTPPSVINSIVDSRPRLADLAILLTDLSEADLRRLFDTSQVFDIIVTSSRQVYCASPFKIGSATALKPEPDGRAVDLYYLPVSKSVESDGRFETTLLKLDTPLDADMKTFISNCLVPPGKSHP